MVATTAPPTPDGLALIAQTIVPAYTPFRPLCLRAQVPDAAALIGQTRGDDRFGQACAVDMHVLAGMLTDLNGRALPRSYRDVSLSPGDPVLAADRAGTIYNELAQQNPETALWATPENADALKECAEEGLLFEVEISGTPAGVVAAVRYDAHGMRGFSIEELCLDQHHRGSGHAQAVLRHLVERLPQAAGDVLWGTIHPANTPSLRNALSMGRRQVAADVWITPSDLPGMPSTES
ncbi:MAG: GNAT family N-acetyltransferase [Actinomycetota bacterium]|nr:GNAT family N-acetyltransferase [Actinomycetota bacterium]